MPKQVTVKKCGKRYNPLPEKKEKEKPTKEVNKNVQE